VRNAVSERKGHPAREWPRFREKTPVARRKEESPLSGAEIAAKSLQGSTPKGDPDGEKGGIQTMDA
jgi:hypothetical protein